MARPGGACSISVLVTHSARWPTTTTTRRHRDLGQGVEDVEDHGSAAQPVQRLGPGRAHPGPLAGGEHDRGQRPTGTPRPAGPPRRRPRPRTRRPTRPPAPGGRSGSPPAGPASDGPRTSAPSVTRCTGHGPILPTSARPMRPGRQTTRPTPGNRRHSPPESAPPHPCPSSTSTIDPTRTPSGPTPAPCPSGLDTVNEQLAAARAGGGERYVERHRERGKLLARERIELLLDRDTAFLELRALAAWGTEYQVGASPDHRHRRGGGGRVPDRRPRPHRAGRRHEPLLLPQGRPGLGHRTPEPAAGHQPGRVGRGRPPGPGRDVHPRGPRPSGTSPGARPPPCPPWPWSSATPPPAAPTSRA